jgi:hypothetical protein
LEASGDVDVVVLGKLDKPIEEVEPALERLEIEGKDVSGANFVTEYTDEVGELIRIWLLVKL